MGGGAVSRGPVQTILRRRRWIWGAVWYVRLCYCRSSWLIYETGGGIFDTGPGFVFNVGGGPGIRVHQFGGGRPRRRPGTAQPPGTEPQPSITSALTSLLPILLLFVLPFISSFFNGSTGSQGPSIIFDGPRSPYTQPRVSKQLKVPYFVKPVDVEDFGTSDRKWKDLDKTAEQRYTQMVFKNCQIEKNQQQQMLDDAQGWGIFPDKAMEERARKMELPNCDRLKKLGYTMNI